MERHPSIYKLKKIHILKARAVDLYKQGLSMREVGKRIGRSPSFVLAAVREDEQKNIENKNP